MRILPWLVLLAACHKEPSKLDDHFAPTTIVEPPGAAQTAHPATPATATAPAGADGLSGTVVETIPASTYTYARLDHDGKELWLAGPETKLAIGAKIGPLQGTLMQEF
ncbi:MAG TPA: hypothetical protein VFQ65_19435, partial [Kofleriaceae bacterium]|nr:hypothetical protein [Kofleriaceae bacterium]